MNATGSGMSFIRPGPGSMFARKNIMVLKFRIQFKQANKAAIIQAIDLLHLNIVIAEVKKLQQPIGENDYSMALFAYSPTDVLLLAIMTAIIIEEKEDHEKSGLLLNKFPFVIPNSLQLST